MASDNEVRLQLKGGRTIKIVRTETPTGGVWSIPEMPEIAAHQNISVIRDRLRGKGLIASRPGAPDTFAVEDRFYFGKGRKERFASISIPRQSVTSGASGTWKKREVTVRGKKAWLVELHRGGVLVGYLNQHPDTRQFHAFDGNTDQQIGIGSEAEMKRLVESL